MLDFRGRQPAEQYTAIVRALVHYWYRLISGGVCRRQPPKSEQPLNALMPSDPLTYYPTTSKAKNTSSQHSLR